MKQKFFSRHCGTILSGILALSLLGNFKGLDSSYHAVMSPYFSSISHWHDEVYESSELERKSFVQAYDEQVRNRILKVISLYKTGLQEDNIGRVSDSIIGESRKYGYDPLFLTALIITESSFYNWARSNRGALGLMQIRPRTGRALANEVEIGWEGTPTLYQPEANIAMGAYYLNKLVRRFGDLALALEAYNRGPTQVARNLRNGQQRSKRYSQRVFKNYHKIRSLEI